MRAGSVCIPAPTKTKPNTEKVALGVVKIKLFVTVCLGEELFEEEEDKASRWEPYMTGNAERCLCEDCS